MTFSITNDVFRLGVASFSAYWSHTRNFKNTPWCVFVTPIDHDTVGVNSSQSSTSVLSAVLSVEQSVNGDLLFDGQKSNPGLVHGRQSQPGNFFLPLKPTSYLMKSKMKKVEKQNTEWFSMTTNHSLLQTASLIYSFIIYLAVIFLQPFTNGKWSWLELPFLTCPVLGD